MLPDPLTLYHPGTSPTVFSVHSMQGQESSRISADSDGSPDRRVIVRHSKNGKVGQIIDRHNFVIADTYTSEDGSEKTISLSLTVAIPRSLTNGMAISHQQLCMLISALQGEVITDIEEATASNNFKAFIRGEP